MSLCTPWPLDDTCLEIPDEATEELIEHWQEVSSSILWSASGQRWGTCEIPARPCLRRCGGSSGLPVPYKGADGLWRNLAGCACTGECSCTELCEVVLDGPVASITEVLIDEAYGGDPITRILDPAAYRLDLVGGGWRLVRTDGGCWPACQDQDADCDEVGAFCVVYEQGIVPDALAIAANTELTAELVKACIPACKTCRLPKNVQQVVRRGVTLSFDNSIAWIKQLPLVNAFLTASNPSGLMSASEVWSPDISSQRQTPSPAAS